MGRERKMRRRDVARAVAGSDAGYLALQCFDVIHMRGFWGRLRWLLTGK